LRLKKLCNISSLDKYKGIKTNFSFELNLNIFNAMRFSKLASLMAA